MFANPYGRRSRPLALVLALAFLAGAGPASAQFSIAPIGEAPLSTHDDWNLFAPGDQPAAFEGDFVDTRQQIVLNLLVPRQDMVAIFSQLEDVLIPVGPPGNPDEVSVIASIFWDARRRDVDAPGSTVLGAGMNLVAHALAPGAGDPPLTFTFVGLTTLTSSQALADAYNLQGSGSLVALVADGLVIDVDREFERGRETTKYNVRVRHPQLGIDFRVNARGGPIGLQTSLDPITTPLGRLQSRIAGASGALNPPQNLAVQYAWGEFGAVEIAGTLGTQLGRFSAVRLNPDEQQRRDLDLELRGMDVE